ncbi:MAG: EF-hand domain-containing protein [Rhodanobacteraceae bacterium]
MSIQRSVRLSLAGAIALSLFGVAAIAAAQTASQQVPPPPPRPTTMPAQPVPPPPPAQPQAAQQQGASEQFYQGTETSATYPLPDSHGGTLTVNTGMPAHVQNYGPPPSFKSLDKNHDGRISEAEARAYPPLDSDFLYASGGGKSISRAQYKKWVQDLH